MVEAELFDHMVALSASDIIAVPLSEVLKSKKRVPLDCDRVMTAREIGISFGD
jgi:6-phosphofructokinase 1